MVNDHMQDYRWTLIYVGKLKEYQVSESRFVDGEWVQVASSRWNNLESALLHINYNNSNRSKEV